MRHNILNPIHKTLRAKLYETALTAQQTNFLDEQEVKNVFNKIESTLSVFEMHSAYERRFIHPLTDFFNHDITRRFNEKHIEGIALAGNVKLTIDTFKDCILSIDNTKNAKSILDALETFVVFNLILFEREEILLNEILWDHYSYEEIEQIEGKMNASLLSSELTLT
jgi:hypothetical protein